MGKTGKRGRNPNKIGAAVPKSIKADFRLDDSPFRWTLKYCLWQHSGWQITAPKMANIVNTLQELETRKWGEIKSDSGGKAKGHGTNSHFIPISKLPKAEAKEYLKLDYGDKYDKIFSLRISSMERLIGVVDMGLFKILWFNPNHEFF
nr:MAG TPA: hypothetical protein [Caudoviricetes sp.]